MEMKRLLLFLLISILFVGFCCAQEGKLVWSDEFDVLNTNTWHLEDETITGKWGNQEYSRENVRVKNGKLIISLKRDADGDITSGRLFDKTDLFAFQYGTIEARMKLPEMKGGFMPSFWMFGTNKQEAGWPAGSLIRARAREQELSINRRVMSSLNSQVENGSTGSSKDKTSSALFDLKPGFHTFRLEWTPDRISTSVGSTQVFTQEISAAERSLPLRLVFRVAINDTGAQQSERSVPISAAMEVDYVHVYSNSHTVQRRLGFAPNAPPPTYVNQLTPPPVFSPVQQPPFPRPTPVFISPVASPVGSPVAGFPGPTPAPTPFPVLVTPAPVTPEPTPFPTTSEPTMSPTSSPTTSEPTSSPTSPPTRSPTSQPTRNPTVPPTQRPSHEPSHSPSASPSATPTMAPSISPQEEMTATGNIMTLQNVEPLDSNQTATWEQITQEHLERELPDILGGEVESLSVTLTAQNPPFVDGNRKLFRRLQTTLEITFDAVVSVKAATKARDESSFVDKAFETEGQKDSYLNELKSSDDAFANASDMSVTQGSSGGLSTVAASAADGGGGVDTSGVPFIVGMSVAGVLVAFIGLFALSRRRRRRQRQKVTRGSFSGTTKKGVTVHYSQSNDNQVKESYPIEVEEDSLYDFDLEVPVQKSRLGDSSIYTGNGSVTIDYDEKVALQKASMNASSAPGAPPHGGAVTESINASPATGAPPPHGGAVTESMDASPATGAPPHGGAVTESYMRRPSAEFYQFTVDAPAGLLGMVLESSVDGTSVYGIKNTSPLASDVQVGDRLIRVDGLDVSEMDATAVSRLIASKKTNKYRNLVFVRPQEDSEQ